VADDALLLIQEGLRGVVRIPAGTAHALDSRGFRIAVMGMTGTTNEFRDALFVGSTYGADGITVAVRIGFDGNRWLGPKETGGRVALPVFQELMLRVYRDQLAGPRPSFPPQMEQRIPATCRAMLQRSSWTKWHPSPRLAPLVDMHHPQISKLADPPATVSVAPSFVGTGGPARAIASPSVYSVLRNRSHRRRPEPRFYPFGGSRSPQPPVGDSAQHCPRHRSHPKHQELGESQPPVTTAGPVLRAGLTERFVTRMPIR
jgi:membrane peptidoglycan carboxypeptidase